MSSILTYPLDKISLQDYTLFETEKELKVIYEKARFLLWNIITKLEKIKTAK